MFLSVGKSQAEVEPRRIDVDNEGGLLKAEIVEFIQRSDIIVADLTNERPNCYLEVGYAMGLGRNQQLVLTVRRDHLPGGAGFRPEGPKVHFDLAGYDLLMWEPDDLDSFRAELTRRIQRRLLISRETVVPEPSASSQPDAWAAELSKRGQQRIRELGSTGFAEISFGLRTSRARWSPRELLDAARESTIQTFGWPIGISLNGGPGSPKPPGNGIGAEVEYARDSMPSYDLWELRTNGDFFLVQSLFEDQRGRSSEILVDTRIVRTTEAILYCARLYERLGLDPDSVVTMKIDHGGLKDRSLSSANPGRLPFADHQSAVDRAEGHVSFMLGEVSAELTDLVKILLAPMFELFDFFVLGDDDH